MPDSHGSVEVSQLLTRRQALALLAVFPATGLTAGEPRRPRHHLLVWKGWVLRVEDLILVGEA